MRFDYWRRRRLERLRQRQQSANPFRALLDGRFWARHYETFAKSKRGQDRREERRFVIAKKGKRIPRRVAI